MIKKILGWAGGGSALPWIVGAVLLVVAGLTGAWRMEAARRDAAELRAEAADKQLAAANAALQDRADVIAAMDRQAAASRALRDELEPTRRLIYAAPRSTACVASPVMRAGLDSLRAARAGPGAGPGPVAGPAGLPGAPGGAGDRTGR
jgi:hypothetical protein